MHAITLLWFHNFYAPWTPQLEYGRQPKTLLLINRKNLTVCT